MFCWLRGSTIAMVKRGPAPAAGTLAFSDCARDSVAEQAAAATTAAMRGNFVRFSIEELPMDGAMDFMRGLTVVGR